MKTIKTPHLLFCFLFIFISSILKAQHFCGSIHKENPQELSEEALRNSVQDRFGNTYTSEDFPKGNSTTYKSPINTGYFNLIFSNFPETINIPGHPNNGEDIRPVICQVFADLTEIISQREHVLPCGDEVEKQEVRILIGNDVCGSQPGCDNATSPIAGTGSPFFSFAEYFSFSDPCFPVVESNVWKKINAKEAFFPIGFDGSLNINTENIDFHYQIDHENPVESDRLDLYSIVLHEALHILGFASRISPNGNPIDAQFSFTDYYSRFDNIMHLTDQFIPTGGSTNMGRLFEGDCNRNCFALNENITDFENLANTSCNASDFDIMLGAEGIATVYGANNNELDILNGMSHLREDCNGNNADYVMDPFISNGEDEREISLEELKILGELGYEINSTNNEITDCFAFAQYDQTLNTLAELTIGYYESCCYSPLLSKIDESLVFDINDMLCNDLSTNEIEISDIYYYDNFWGGGTFENIGGSMYEFVGKKDIVHRIYYTVKSCDCYLSTAYFDIIVSSEPPTCDESKCDNLVCIGDFENLKKTNDLYFQLCQEDVFYMQGANQNTPDICESGNNQFLTILNIIGAEASLITLDHPILPGCTMEISADLVSRGGEPNGQLNIMGSSTKPCHPSEVFIQRSCNQDENVVISNPCESYDYNPFCLLVNEPISNTFGAGQFICPNIAVEFESYSWTIQNIYEEPIEYLVIYNESQPSVIWMDNLDIRSSCPPEVVTSPADITINDDLSTGFVEIEVCFSDVAYTGFENEDVQILVTLPPNVNFAIGGDFVNGMATIENLEPGECQTLQLAIQSDVMGTYEINFEANVEDLCVNQSFSSLVTVLDASNVHEIEFNAIPQDADFYLVNILGQWFDTERKDHLHEFRQANNQQLPGIYFIVAVDQGKIIFSQKVIF